MPPRFVGTQIRQVKGTEKLLISLPTKTKALGFVLNHLTRREKRLITRKRKRVELETHTWLEN